MSFFKGLFSKKDKSKGEQFIPTPTQEVSGIPPIVVQAIENLFPSIDDQKSAFKCILEYTGGKSPDSPIVLLALLSYSHGEIENLRVAVANMRYPHFCWDEIEPIFPKMRNAEEWVKSITKTRT